MKRTEKGFSLIELLIVIAVIGIIAAIAVPNLLQSRMAGNEASAISTVRNVVSAQATYMTSVGSGKYAPLTTLNGSGMVDSVVASGTKDGYSFAVSLGAGNSAFSVTARPANFQYTGVRSFYSNESGVIRYTTADAAATSASSPLGE